jgi:hypothetical protein
MLVSFLDKQIRLKKSKSGEILVALCKSKRLIVKTSYEVLALLEG